MPRITLGVLGGVTQPDPGLSDFRWDVSARPVWGAQALVDVGPATVGLRLKRFATTQGTGLPDAPPDPAVRVTTVDALSELSLVSLPFGRLLGRASLGRMHLGYDPDRLLVDSPGLPEPIEVAYEEIDEWVYGLGGGLRRPLGPTSLTLVVDRTWFSLDTAHRNGAEIEYERRSFGSWDARLELSVSWPGK